MLLVAAAACDRGPAGVELAPFEDACPRVPGSVGVREDGYRGIWYGNGSQPGEYAFKYSGGLGTYPQQHIPMAVYAPAVHRTFFVYGGRAADRNVLSNMVSFYDHASGGVPRPVAVVERSGDDAHDNPTLALDREGFVYVFANVHGGRGRTAFIYRSTCPYSISAFRVVRSDDFSYSQVWPTDRAMVWLHTRYGYDTRPLFWSRSATGLHWSGPEQLVDIGRGSYQISWGGREKVATAFDYHPQNGGVDARTNLYYLETTDDGHTWTTAAGVSVSTPVVGVRNEALVHDYEAERLLVYLKDLKLDAAGRPVILYLTSRAAGPGPRSGPRTWRTARWTGAEWEIRTVAESDHNYDHGSLYIEADGSWRVIAPLLAGSHPYMTGGDVVALRSTDFGRTWAAEHTLAADPFRNYSYVRGPLNAHPDLYAIWADGNPAQPSLSEIFFASKEGRVFRLPYTMSGPAGDPEPVDDELAPASWLGRLLAPRR